MSPVWYCATCGYEVGAGGRCHNCRELLIESPLAELAEDETSDEVGYRIADWDDSQRGELIEALIDEEILHRFEGDELVVAADDEAAVDALIAGLSGGAPSPGPVDVDVDAEADEATVAALEAVLHAARRLRTDPTDMVADGELAEAGAAVFAIDHVYGVDAETWASIGRVTRRLLGALGADFALEEEISTQAGVLCRLLEPIVSPTDADATPWTASRPSVHFPPRYAPPPVAAAGDDADQQGEATGDDGETDGGDRHQVVYDLSDWLPEERVQLGLLLERDGVAHEWEGADLVVSEDDWDRVDELCAEINPLAESDEDDEETDAGYQALSELFGAADRLAGDPEDKSKRQTLVDAAAAVTQGPVPFGMSDSQWWQVKTRAGTLLDSLEAGAGPDVIRDSAATLSGLLRGFV